MNPNSSPKDGPTGSNSTEDSPARSDRTPDGPASTVHRMAPLSPPGHCRPNSLGQLIRGRLQTVSTAPNSTGGEPGGFRQSPPGGQAPTLPRGGGFRQSPLGRTAPNSTGGTGGTGRLQTVSTRGQAPTRPEGPGGFRQSPLERQHPTRPRGTGRLQIVLHSKGQPEGCGLLDGLKSVLPIGSCLRAAEA